MSQETSGAGEESASAGDWRWAEAIVEAEEPILRQIGGEGPLSEVLEAICRMVEAACAGSRCAVFLLDADGSSLRLAAAPELPESYRETVGVIPVREAHRSCSAAARLGQPAIAEGIANDPAWEDGRDAALEAGLRACWSVPILASSGEVLGVFETFLDRPIRPDGRELKLCERAARFAGIAIEKRRGEERFLWLVDVIDQGIWAVDERQQTTFVNDKMADMLGCRPQEMIGRPARDFTFSDDHDEGERRWEERKRGVRGRSALRLRHRDGSAVWVRSSTRRILDDNGQFAGALGTFADVTEERRENLALRESEGRLRQLADTMPQMVWTAGPEGIVDYFNARWYEYTGLSPEQTLSHEGWSVVVHPDDVGRLYEARNRAVGIGETFEAETRLRDRDGNYRWHLVRSVPVEDESGQVIRRFGAATDIDDRRRSEEALRESEKTLRLLADSIPQLAWMARPDGSVFWFNRRWYDYTGTTPEQMEEWGWQSVHDPSLLPGILAKFQEAVARREPWEDLFPLRRSDGAMRWHLSRALPLLEDDGRIVRWFGTNTDITDRMELEEALRQSDERKTEFLATLAHELRNPLAPIRNALYLMKHERGGVEFESERGMAERQVVHLSRLVEDLMDVSRINRGKLELRKEVAELIALVRHAVDAARPSFEGRGQMLDIELPADPILVEADPTRLEQVIDNLLTNAAKYTDHGGRIRLAVDRRGDEAVLSVQDSGIGIAPEMLPRVFEMFVQAERRSERSRGGLGIGLGLVKRLVEMHGGRITARSGGLGLGSEFTVQLPVASRPAAEGTGVKPAMAPTLVRRRVLVADDNTDAADSLGRLLTRKYRQEVRVSHDGLSALSAAEEFHPEVAILDIDMPGMNGYELAKALRSRPEFTGTLLIALTGWGQESDRQRSRDAGFDHHLVKPVAPEALRDILLLFGVEPSHA